MLEATRMRTQRDRVVPLSTLAAHPGPDAVSEGHGHGLRRRVLWVEVALSLSVHTLALCRVPALACKGAVQEQPAPAPCQSHVERHLSARRVCHGTMLSARPPTFELACAGAKRERRGCTPISTIR